MTQVKTCLLIDMETPSLEEDADHNTLTDSGTESFNESPVTDEENSQSGTEPKQRAMKNLLDKSISVDEDSLIRPLEPVVCNTLHSNNDGNHSDQDQKAPLVSILRRISCFDLLGDEDEQAATPRRVSFPVDLAVLASYKEPDLRSPFHLSNVLTNDDILRAYQNSCMKHNTIELDIIKQQIIEIKNNTNYSANLNLAQVSVTMEVCETLEDLFKIVNFHSINTKECKFTAESIREFINVLEYYNCATEYVVSEQFKEHDAWKSFCNMTSRCYGIESLVFDSINFVDSQMYMKSLLANIKSNDSINTLKFNSCIMGNSQNQLLDNLSSNPNIQELYLPQTGLYTKEADALGKLLSKNCFLKVLDISNNLIGDRGLEVLAKGLCHQTIESCGLSVLVIFNNQITEKSGPSISNIIAECKNLHTLNIGFNQLTDEVIYRIEDSLAQTQSLEGLGLQSTLLTDKGISKLAEAIQRNTSLLKINIKGNKAIQVEGLEKLSQALTNSKITKVELEETNRNCDDPQGFLELVKQINAICTVNKSRPDQSTDDEMSSWSMTFSRKVSLNCEPIYYQLLPEPVNSHRKKSPIPSPIPSPGCSPMPRSRFSVVRVPDPIAPKPVTTNLVKSRFKVYAVPTQSPGPGGDTPMSSPPPDEADEVKFANVRSSVSSIDSVDSVSTNRDSVYDSATPSGESD